MPIPTQQDYDLAAIDDMAACIKLQLMTMRRAGRGMRDFERLRADLKTYVNEVMGFAHDTEG